MGIKSKIIGALLVIVMTGSLAFWGHWERQGRQEAEQNAKDAQNTIESLLSTIEDERASAERTEALAQSVQEKLDAAETRYDRAIADAMLNGAGLYVAADCPERAELPETGTPASKPDATRARVDRATEVNIRRLERDAEKAEVMIDGLQEYINTECEAKRSPD